MSPSRLRLGPVDGLDEDYDPLLGRTARDHGALPVQPAPADVTAAGAGPGADAVLSVFDEPDPFADPSQPDPGPPGPADPVTGDPDIGDARSAGPASPVADRVRSAAADPESVPEPIPDTIPVFDGTIPVRRLPTQAPGTGLFVFRNPWRQPAQAQAPALDPSDGAASDPAALPPERLPRGSQPEDRGPGAGILSDETPADETPAAVIPEDAAHPADVGAASVSQQRTPVADGPSPGLPADGAGPRAAPSGVAVPPPVRRPRRPRPGVRTVRMSGPPRDRTGGRDAPPWALAAGTFLTATAVLLTAAALAGPLGGAFAFSADHLMYCVIVSLAGLAVWGWVRAIAPAVVTLLVLLVQGVIVLPALGEGPRGGPPGAVVGWASLAGSPAALDAALAQAGKQGAELLLLGDAPRAIAARLPDGWQVVAVPAAGDTSSITILSRGPWRAAVVPGEPAMARAGDNSLTVIGVNPPPSEAASGDGAAREAEINRSAARAGVQTTPTLAIGNFELVPWSRPIGQFTSYGNVTRVRCGGLFGATRGLLPLDHAFVRGVQVARCRTGSALPDSGHRPIWVTMAQHGR